MMTNVKTNNATTTNAVCVFKLNFAPPLANKKCARVRFGADSVTVEQLKSTIRSLPGVGALQSGVRLQYTDSDGDLCTITTDAELVEALTCAGTRKGNPNATNKHGKPLPVRTVLTLRVMAQEQKENSNDKSTAAVATAAAAAAASVTSTATTATTKGSDEVAVTKQPLSVADHNASATPANPAKNAEAKASALRQRIANVKAKREALGEGHARRHAQLSTRLEMLENALKECEAKQQTRAAAPLLTHSRPVKLARPIVDANEYYRNRAAAVRQRIAKLQQAHAALAATHPGRAVALAQQMIALAEKACAFDELANAPAANTSDVAEIRAFIAKLQARHEAVQNKAPKRASLIQIKIALLTERASTLEHKQNARRGPPPHIVEKIAAAKAAKRSKAAAPELREQLQVLQARRDALDVTIGQIAARLAVLEAPATDTSTAAAAAAAAVH